MIVNQEEVERKLVEVYPNLIEENVWPTDTKYLLPVLDEVVSAIERNSVKDLPYVSNIGECEEFALYLHAAIKKERHLNWENLPKEERYNWAFGEAIGFRFDLLGSQNHTMNIVITSDFEVRVIEPRNNGIQMADVDKFSAFFVKF
jgi:hypothetical protein